MLSSMDEFEGWHQCQDAPPSHKPLLSILQENIANGFQIKVKSTHSPSASQLHKPNKQLRQAMPRQAKPSIISHTVQTHNKIYEKCITLQNKNNYTLYQYPSTATLSKLKCIPELEQQQLKEKSKSKSKSLLRSSMVKSSMDWNNNNVKNVYMKPAKDPPSTKNESDFNFVDLFKEKIIRKQIKRMLGHQRKQKIKEEIDLLLRKQQQVMKNTDVKLRSLPAHRHQSLCQYAISPKTKAIVAFPLYFKNLQYSQKQQKKPNLIKKKTKSKISRWESSPKNQQKCKSQFDDYKITDG